MAQSAKRSRKYRKKDKIKAEYKPLAGPRGRKDKIVVREVKREQEELDLDHEDWD
jgi:hypothetical protein